MCILWGQVAQIFFFCQLRNLSLESFDLKLCFLQYQKVSVVHYHEVCHLAHLVFLVVIVSMTFAVHQWCSLVTSWHSITGGASYNAWYRFAWPGAHSECAQEKGRS